MWKISSLSKYMAIESETNDQKKKKNLSSKRDTVTEK